MSLFRHYLSTEWPELRRAGQQRFIWSRRALPIGFPGGILLALLQYRLRDYSVHDALFTIKGLALGYFMIAGTVLIVFVRARFEWRRREVHYRSPISPCIADLSEPRPQMPPIKKSAIQRNFAWGMKRSLLLTVVVFTPALLASLTSAAASLTRLLAIFMCYAAFAVVGGLVIGALRPRLHRRVPSVLTGAALGLIGVVALVCLPTPGHPFPGIGVMGMSAAVGFVIGGSLGWWTWKRHRTQ